ncbi:MAG: carbonic anhydrase [Bdellovibrionota bacterium]
MKELLTGINKFSKQVHPKKTDLFKKLETGQQPHTLFITCSDSRIDPSLITQTEPGEIFIVRNAGNIVPPYGASRGGEEATIEYAVDGLKVRNIVVCGHSHCGAMSALLDKNLVSKMPAVSKWLEHAESTLRRVQTGEVSVDEAVKTNTRVQVDNLKTHPSVATTGGWQVEHLFVDLPF